MIDPHTEIHGVVGPGPTAPATVRELFDYRVGVHVLGKRGRSWSGGGLGLLDVFEFEAHAAHAVSTGQVCDVAPGRLAGG